MEGNREIGKTRGVAKAMTHDSDTSAPKENKMKCGLIDLTKLENPEYGGENSTTYRCPDCENFFSATPYEVKVVFGTGQSHE
jgi:hypothetical protein